MTTFEIRCASEREVNVPGVYWKQWTETMELMEEKFSWEGFLNFQGYNHRHDKENGLYLLERDKTAQFIDIDTLDQLLSIQNTVQKRLIVGDGCI